MRNDSADPSSYFKLLARFIRLQCGEVRLQQPHAETHKPPASRGIISDPAAEDGRAEREQALRCHARPPTILYACAHARWLKAHYYYCCSYLLSTVIVKAERRRNKEMEIKASLKGRPSHSHSSYL
ncbi:uncharacterized protein V6R79_001530 [Siganus canaliculatus]